MAKAVEVFQGTTGPQCNTVQGFLGNRNRQTRLFTQAQVQILQMRTTAGKHDTVIDDIRRQIRWRGLKCHHYRLDDLLDRFGQCLGNLALGNFLLFGNAIQQVAPTDRQFFADTVRRHPS